MNRSLLPIFLIVIVDVLGLTLILPLLPFYAEHYGASPAMVGMLSATFALCQLIAGPVLGQLSDRFGRKPLLIVSQLGTFAGFLLMANATHLWMIFVARAIDGATAGNITIAQAYIADVTEPKNRARAFGLIGIAFGLGFLVGPGISGLLAHYDLRYPIFVAAALSFTSVVTTYLLLPWGKPPGAHGDVPRRVKVLDVKTYARYFARPRLGNFLGQFFIYILGFAVFTGGFALFAERRLTWDGRPFGPREVGLVFAFAGFLGAILQGGLIHRLVAKFGEERLIVYGFAANVLGYLVLGFTAYLPILVVSAMITAFGNGSLRPSLTSIITQAVERNEQGLVLGLTQSLTSVGQIVGPLLAGLLIEHGYLGAWAWSIALLSLVGIALRPGRQKLTGLG
jgi:MFS family permease